MNSEPHNPYQPPQSEISALVPVVEGKLASPGIRLGASFIDNLILGLVRGVLQTLFAYNISPGVVFKATHLAGPVEMRSLMPGLLLGSAFSLVLFIALNFIFLQNGQTIGKKLLRLQVQRRSDSTVLPIQDYILRRFVPIHIVPILAVLISPFMYVLLIVDSAMIFRSTRNTLHDDIAGSKVVRLSS